MTYDVFQEVWIIYSSYLTTIFHRQNILELKIWQHVVANDNSKYTADELMHICRSDRATQNGSTCTTTIMITMTRVSAMTITLCQGQQSHVHMNALENHLCIRRSPEAMLIHVAYVPGPSYPSARHWMIIAVFHHRGSQSSNTPIMRYASDDTLNLTRCDREAVLVLRSKWILRCTELRNDCAKRGDSFYFARQLPSMTTFP